LRRGLKLLECNAVKFGDAPGMNNPQVPVLIDHQGRNRIAGKAIQRIVDLEVTAIETG